MIRWIYQFSETVKIEQDIKVSSVKEDMTYFVESKNYIQKLLGNKGMILAQMYSQKLPIPPGFTITSKLYHYYRSNNTLPLSFFNDLKKAIIYLERKTGKYLGNLENPLLVSVRSGAAVSMPGMMDTVLNVGINDEIVETIAALSGNRIFALDSYRRFIQIYGNVVMGVPSYVFEKELNKLKILHSVTHEHQFTSEQLLIIITAFKQIIKYETKEELPQDVIEQLHSSIKAVLKSWTSNRAVIYRKLNNISEDLGTAITIQSMVFGNMGNDSATGVVFTRNPATGVKELYGEFLVNAQGEDIVAGIRTPNQITNLANNEGSLQCLMPDIYAELVKLCQNIEQYYKDIQDIEFTVEKQKLYILQVRPGKCTAQAAIKIAVDMVKEGLITKEEAIERINPESLNQLLHVHIDYNRYPKVIAQGLAASPGAATGVIAFSVSVVEKMSLAGYKVILVRPDTSPEDIKAMHISAGILTSCGGITSHAAVIARGIGKACVCGIKNVMIDEEKCLLVIDGITLRQGEEITIDGNNGKVLLGKVSLVQPKLSEEFQLFMSWTSEINGMEIRANAETIPDAQVALNFGAKAIGLCRTEHMLLEDNKINLIREIIITSDDQYRKKVLEELLPLHKEDFKKLFAVTKNLSINVRFLDAPLHEFLPQVFAESHNYDILARLNISQEVFKQRINALKEINPMLGHRGCRIGITFPEIYEMQAQAVFEAVAEMWQELNILPKLEITLPLISHKKEFELLKKIICKVGQKVKESYKCNFDWQIGSMIELPRAALGAYDIAKEAAFFSFGTNDLTQTIYGISRDDIASFLNKYIENNIFLKDPFVVLDQEGVGELIEIAVNRGRQANPNLKIGICGEHAGNPLSIEFFHKIGSNYISCSPYRVPVAKLAAAQAAVKNKRL